jgi:transcriptional regulator with XRE-family HTH domain
MENNIEINQRIAKNLMHYRKAAGFTQAELAEKINYSDKSVSKWESGNGVPDIYTLMQLAELYGITVDTLIGKGVPVAVKKPTKGLHLLIMLLSSGIVWLVATCIFVLLRLLAPTLDAWMAFIYALPVNAIVMVVYASVWKYRLLNFFSISTIIWTALLSLYLTVRFILMGQGEVYEGMWTLFLLGIPLQVLEILWAFFRSLFRKNKKMLVVREGEEEEKEEAIEE